MSRRSGDAMGRAGFLTLAALSLLAMGALVMGCQGCATSSAGDIRKCRDVPPVLAGAPLVSYRYTLSGTMRWPLRLESVELCPGDSSHCIIRLFEEASSTPENFTDEGELRPDSLVAGIEVLDTIRQMIIGARAWRFKDDYSPRASVHDGYSWSYSATFALTDSMLAATPEAERPRLLRRGGLTLASGGSNAWPDTDLFERVSSYLDAVWLSGKAASEPIPANQ